VRVQSFERKGAFYYFGGEKGVGLSLFPKKEGENGEKTVQSRKETREQTWLQCKRGIKVRESLCPNKDTG